MAIFTLESIADVSSSIYMLQASQWFNVLKSYFGYSLLALAQIKDVDLKIQACK
jgi:hypothetical protein